MTATTEALSSTRGTIVVAEDDVATRMLLCQVLTRERFNVIAVDNGRLACDAVRREKPDVVLLDWRMPVMDGRAVLEELKGDKHTRGIPIVMLTSASAVDERILAMESGVQDFLSKPFDPRELVACIEQQLRWRHGLTRDARAAFLEERNALLAASERRYRLLTEAMPHMVWLAEPDGRITYVNRAWTQFTGLALSDTGSGGWTAALHPDDREAARRGWSQSLASGEPYEIQCRFARAGDGMYRWHLGRAIPTSNAEGTIVEWVGSCADIHEYKIAGETRAILDTLGSIVAIRTDGGFVDYTGPYWSQYTGSHAGSGLGEGWRDFVHRDDLSALDDSRRRLAMDQGEPHCEIRVRGHDAAYRWFLVRSTMLPRGEGTPQRWLDTWTDIEDLKRTQSALENSDTRYRALTDAMPQMVWVLDAAQQYEYVNERWLEYTGLGLAETRAVGGAAFVNRKDLAIIERLRDAPVPVEYTCEARFRRHDGVYRWHMVRAVPFHDVIDRSRKWVGTATDIEDSKAAADRLALAAAELEHIAHYDAVTQLPNRTLLFERLGAAIASAQRAKTSLIVMYIDLDRFKTINDTLGHAAGDRVLEVTGKRISDALRAGDTGSRVGGDEFVLICATTDGPADAARLATRLHAALSEPIDVLGETVAVGASIGISFYPADGITGDELIEKADAAMYRAKQSGRNAFRVYSPNAHSSIVAALDFEGELREAIAAGQFTVQYQPAIDSRSGDCVGARAIVRWQHPARGMLDSEAFLPFAEERGLSRAIDDAVLAAVCRRVSALDASANPLFSIAVPARERQIAAPGFADRIVAAVIAHGVAAHRLTIEISEDAALAVTAALRDELATLRQAGVCIAIGGFGTAYRRLLWSDAQSHDVLTIDAQSVGDLCADGSRRAAVAALVKLGYDLGYRVIASQVEGTEQLATLQAATGDALTSYISNDVVDEHAFTEMLARQHARREAQHMKKATALRSPFSTGLR